VAGPDGKLWFTEYNAEQLSSITTAGVVTRVQRIRGGPWGIGAGLNNTLWITLFDGNKISRFRVGP
jgi:virginiamycin B lyase